MDSYLVTGKKEEPANLRISVTNIPEFEALIEQAQKEADQLRETVRQLANFYLNIEISSTTNEQV